MRGYAVLCLALLLVTPSAAEAAGAREAIEAKLDAFEAAFNRGDAAAVAGFYTEDAVLLPPDAERVEGRQAVAAYWREGIDGGLTDLDLKAFEVMEAGALAYEIGAFSLNSPGEGEQPVSLTGKYIVIWQRGADGEWRLHRDIWNFDPVPE